MENLEYTLDEYVVRSFKKNGYGIRKIAKIRLQSNLTVKNLDQNHVFKEDEVYLLYIVSNQFKTGYLTVNLTDPNSGHNRLNISSNSESGEFGYYPFWWVSMDTFYRLKARGTILRNGGLML